ncbi:MAG: MoaD/ThiS family protein [Lachnospirales bacterium]
MVRARYFGILAQKIGKKEEDFQVTDVSDILKMIKKEYGKEIHKIAKTSHIVVNEENAAYLKGFKTKLCDGDVVRFLPICGGG